MGCTVRRGESYCPTETSPLVRLSTGHGVQNACEHPQIPRNTKCFSASAAKEQVAQAREYHLLPLPADSNAWIVWTKQDPGIKLRQQHQCKHRTSSRVRTVHRAWESPERGGL